MSLSLVKMLQGSLPPLQQLLQGSLPLPLQQLQLKLQLQELQRKCESEVGGGAAKPAGAINPALDLGGLMVTTSVLVPPSSGKTLVIL